MEFVAVVNATSYSRQPLTLYCNYSEILCEFSCQYIRENIVEKAFVGTLMIKSLILLLLTSHIQWRPKDNGGVVCRKFYVRQQLCRFLEI